MGWCEVGVAVSLPSHPSSPKGEGIGWKRVDRSLRRPIKQHTENLNEYRRNTQFYS